VLDGKEVRFSLKTRDEKDANNKIHALRNPTPGEPATSAKKTLAAAWKDMIGDLQTRVSYETVRKYQLLERQMIAFAQEYGLTDLEQFDLDALSKFRKGWKDGHRSSQKKVERLRALFNFAVARKWVSENPAKFLKVPNVSICPTLPLTDAEFAKLIMACETLQLAAQPSGKAGMHRVKTLVLLMRYSGLRISDAVSLTTDRLDGKKLFLYTQKTDVPVYTVLPDFVLHALAATPRVTEKNYFWSGNGKRETAVCDYQEKLKKVFKKAGIVKKKGASNATSHRLRDTFATGLLLVGVPLDRVAVLLGNSVKVCEKHYSAWTRDRQKQLESDLASAWKLDALTESGGTIPVHFAQGRPN
jgi:site-specific recombinase XerD